MENENFIPVTLGGTAIQFVYKKTVLQQPKWWDVQYLGLWSADVMVLLMKKYSWGPEGGAPTIEEIPDSEKEKALEMHKALVEALFSAYNILLHIYLILVKPVAKLQKI